MCIYASAIHSSFAVIQAIDDSLVSQWQDSTPLTSGGFISLRTGGCSAEFDNIHVYHSRGNQVIVSTSGSNGEMMIESENATPSGAIHSIVIDSADLWSPIDFDTYLIDFTPPTMNTINDGFSNDIDTFTTTLIEGNWNIEDIHSFIASYEVAVGTLPTLDDIYPWTNNSISAVFSTVLTSPIYDEVYYISVRSTNNAGLNSEYTSNGQRYIDDLGLDYLSNELAQIILYPNPSSEFISFKNTPKEFDVIISDVKGRVCFSETLNENEKINISQFQKGVYNIIIKIQGFFIVKELIIN